MVKNSICKIYTKMNFQLSLNRDFSHEDVHYFEVRFMNDHIEILLSIRESVSHEPFNAFESLISKLY